MITITAKFSVLPESLDEFIKAAGTVAKESRKERGNLAYKVFRSRSADTEFTFIEEWQNDTAIELHNQSKHFNEFINIITPLTNGEPQIEQLVKIPSIFY